jgi:hypothetical protein
MDEREAFLAGWRYAAESMVQAHDQLIDLIAETVARLAFDEGSAEGDRVSFASTLDTFTLATMFEVRHVRLDPGAAGLAFEVWRIGQA